MKKLYLLLFLLIFALSGCNSGSGSGGGGESNNFMTGYWSGQWSDTTTAGPLSVHLTQNGKQLTGEVVSEKNNVLDGGGRFSATLSNPNGSGNIELGVMWNDFKSVKFNGTYNRNQIYGQLSLPNQSGEGTFTITR